MIKMLICRTIEIDMGHRIPNHKSKCRNLHGHRYKIEVCVDDKIITRKGDSSEGMVIDYGDLKEILLDEIDKKYDHALVIYWNDEFRKIFEELKLHGQKIVFVNFIPTAENLARHWYNKLKLALSDRKINIKYVKVWETPNSVAVYEE